MKKIFNKKFQFKYLLMFFGVSILVSAPFVSAESLQQQINNLQNKNTQTQASVDSLQSQASSFQDAINKLQNQINAVQNDINASKNRITDLEVQIAQAQKDLDYQKTVLASNVKAIYVSGQTSTTEMLASSKNLSVYIDQQTYQKAVEGKIQKSLNQIANLQNQMNTQKNQVKQTLVQQQLQNSQLASTQVQQQSLLGYNQSQQDQYNHDIQANQATIASLRQQQAAANKKLDSTGSLVTSGTCGGSYPGSATGQFGSWGCNFEHTSDFIPGCKYIDSWGMCNRECVSYTAWIVYQKYGISTRFFGDAKNWPSSARNAGLSVGSTPKVGAVGIYEGGSFGHAMWIVGIDGSQVHVYSYNDGYDGNFYDHWVDASNLTYIYFGG